MSKERIIQEITDHLASGSNGDIAGSPDAFICIYGSSAYAPARSGADVDLMCAVPDTHVDSIDVDELAEVIKTSHIKYGHKVDQEVPYANKLIYGFSDITDAARLQAFGRDTDGKVVVPEIQKNPDFLCSRHIKLRLALNALTTPNIVISGNPNMAKRLSKLAGIAMTTVGISLIQDSRFKPNSIVETLCMSSTSTTGEMFLGYKTEYSPVERQLRSIVVRSLYSLSQRGGYITSTSGSETYERSTSFDAFRQMATICDTFKLKELKDE